MGTYDPETGLVTVASDQLVFNGEEYGYGLCYEYGMDDDFEEQDNMTLQFTPLGGSLASGYYGIYSSSLGDIDACYTTMKHK